MEVIKKSAEAVIMLKNKYKNKHQAAGKYSGGFYNERMI